MSENLRDMTESNGYYPLVSGDVQGERKKSVESEKNERLLSLDVFRGMTIFVMNFVNSADGSYPIFSHAIWNGLTIADFVMPFFLFIVGVSIVLSHNKLKTKVTRREIFIKSFIRFLKLFIIGLAMMWVGRIPGINLDTIRIPGVLQRIAVGYLVAVIIELTVPTFSFEEEGLDMGYVPLDTGIVGRNYYYLSRGPLRVFLKYSLQWACGLTLLFSYLALALGVDVPQCGRGSLTPSCNAFSYIDERIIGSNHMYKYPTCIDAVPPCIHFDPEGFLSTWLSIVSVIIGLYYGYVLVNFQRKEHRLIQWIIPSIIMLSVGLIIHFTAFPLNKNLYSPSFLFVMGGASGIFLCIYYIIVDVYGLKNLFLPFLWLGSNAIIIYILAEMVPLVLEWFYWKERSHNIPDAIHTGLKNGMGHQNGNLMWGLINTLVWIPVAAFLYYRKIFVKL